MNTRRQHSLLTVSLAPPLKRFTLLNKVDEELIIEGKSFFLGTNQYPGKVFPEGYRYLSKFILDYFPEIDFELDGNRLSKKILMPGHSSSVFIHYENQSKKEMTLRLLPMISFRLKDDLIKEGDGFLVDELPDGVRIMADMALPRLYLKLSQIYSTSPESFWYRDFIYHDDNGDYGENREDLYNIGYWETVIEPGKGLTFAASTRDLGEFNFGEIERRFVEEAEHLRQQSGLPKKFGRLADAASRHIVKSKISRGFTFIRGYPYGAVKTRDSLIALDGISHLSDKSNFESSFLYNIVANELNGILPASVDELTQQVRYDDPEIPLYLGVALYRSGQKDSETEIRRRFLPTLENAADMIIENNSGDKKSASDQLILSDGAKDFGSLVKNASLNALWYSLLRLIDDTKIIAGETPKYSELATDLELSYYEKYFESDGNFRMHISDSHVSAEMAIPLVVPFSPLNDEQAARICRQLSGVFLNDLAVAANTPGGIVVDFLAGIYLCEAASRMRSCQEEFGKLKEFADSLLSFIEIQECVSGLCRFNKSSKSDRRDISSLVMIGEAIRLVKLLRLK